MLCVSGHPQMDDRDVMGFEAQSKRRFCLAILRQVDKDLQHVDG